MKRRVLISGINGQDGSYLTDFLLDKDYEIYGLLRRSSHTATDRLRHCLDRIRLIPGDVTDQSSLMRAVKLADPHEVYNFAAMSYVAHSFEAPISTMEITGGGTVKLLEAVRHHAPHARFYQASSSEMFGSAEMSPQTEETPFRPISPYGCAKVYAHTMAVTYREAYQMFICCGIAYNHESPRRGEEFVTRKITKAVARIKAGQQDELRLGSLYTKRDWSHARDIVKGAWLTLQQNRPDDYVFASGISHSVLELVELAFNYAGLDYQKYVKTDPTLLRPTDVHHLLGLSAKATQLLGWKPTVSFSQLVQEMVENDCALVEHSNSVSLR